MVSRIVLGLACFLTASVCLSAQNITTQAPTTPTHKYPLTDREGPWLIHVGSFRGDEALDYAQRLAEETRSKHRLLAFVYSMNEADAVRDREELRQQQLQMVGSDKIAESNERQKFRTIRIVKEYSVFVGNYPDMQTAREASVAIKEFAPPTSIPSYGVHLYNTPTTKVDPDGAGSIGPFRMKSTVKTEEGKRMGEMVGNPYRQAFCVRNPLLSRNNTPAVVTKQAPTPIDPSWKELNAREKHSIFTCNKSWTLVVAKFSPPAEVQGSDSIVQTGGTRPNLGRDLEAAAETARQVAELLRDGGKGYDAYVFHTRQYSLVTVGSFESRFDPNMEQAWVILKQFAETQEKGPFSLLMKVPQPMQIPGTK